MIGDSERPLKITKKKFNKKTSHEEKATRIASAEESELDQGVGNIIEQFQGFDSKRMEDKYQKELKTNNNTEIAEEFRNGSLETFGEKNTDCRLKRVMISHLQSRRKEDLFLKYFHTCERKRNKGL